MESDHDIEVSATTKQIFQTYVESSSTKLNSGESSFSGAVAMSVNLIENNVEAIIEGGAQVDAIETLSVLSDIKYPFITHPYDYDPIGIDEIAEADETTGKITAIKEGLMSTMDGKLGLQRLLFHSWTTSRTAPSGDAPASDVAVTGTVSIISMDTTCVAKIGAGALINQKVAMQTSNTQSVEVRSTALANIFYLTGNISLNLQPVPGAGGNGAIDTYKKKLKNAKDQLNPLNWINLYGAEGGKLGLGGTVMVANIDFDTRATIEANSKVHTGINGSISVEAETTGFYLFITEAGGKSDKVAISATVPVVTLNNKTIAKISGTAVIEAGDISLSALDDLVLLNVAGGISSSHSIGIGATIGINNISRETLAFVGNQETGETGLWNVVFNSNGDASDISATVLPDINGPAYQETKVEGKLNTQEVVIVDVEGNTNSDATFKLNFNGAITTDIAYQATEEEVQAALDALNIPGGVQVTQGDEDAWVIIFNNFGDQDSFEVESTTDFDIDATVEINTYLEGAVDTQEEQLIILDQDISEGVFTVRFGEHSRNKTAPLFWDVSAADLEAAIEALDGVDDVLVTQTTNDDGDKEFSILFNTFGLQNRFYINGVNEYNGTPNISITQGTYSTQEVVTIENPSYQGAFVLEYNGLTSAPIEWDASDEEIEAALIVLGANVDVSSGDVQNVMSTPSITATRLDINAENKGLVVVLAITGVMISKEDSGGSGGSDDSSGNNQSKIPTGGVPTVFKQMSLLQQGHSLDDIRSGKYKDNTSAKDQGVQSPASTNSPTKTGSASISLAGSISIMMLEDVVKASIQNAGLITLSEDANIVAKNSTKMINVAGSAALNLKSGSSAGSLSIGIAGAVTYNELTGKTETGIDHTAIKARDISTSATQEGLIVSVSAGVAGDLAKKGISIAGSISLNYLDNDTASRITDAAIELSGGLSSSADDDRLAVVVAGAVAFGGMAGVGASVAINNIESDTIARIDNSNIDYATWIKQEAESSKQLTSISATIALSKKFGVAGTVSINKIIGQNLASISGGNIDSDDAGSNIILEAYDDSVISSISGAVGGGKTAGLGAAFAYNKLDNDVVATIDEGATINILGNIDVLASADGKIETISAGGAGAQTIGFSAAISINLLLNDVIASINQATITTDGSVTVNAKSNNTVHALAGNVAGAGKVALGASVGYNIFNTITSAYIKDSTIISKKHVLVDANEDSEVYALAAGGQFSGKVAIGGSVVITDADSKITAFIDNSTVTADGNIRVSATDDRYLFLLAGVINGAGTVAFGVSANVLLTYNNVSAYVSNSTISAQAIKGKKKIKGADRTMKDYSGVAVVAASKEEMLSFAVGGSGAGTAAINVSGSVNLPEEETEAWIENSSVNVGVTGDDQQQSVIVRAIDDTELWGIAGAIGGAGTAGIGLGADVGMLEKNTRAYVEYSTIETLNNDVIVQAISTEDIFSVSASGGLAGTVGIAGATSIYTLEINTVAYILGDTTTIFANDSVLVSAYDETSLFIVSGSISGAGTVSVGGVVTFSSYEKDVFAYVGDGVEINALANGDGIEVHDGTYNITWTDGITDPNNANYGDADPLNINATNIDDGNDEIIINDHGYETGTAVIYTNTSGSAIPGLVDGETYYIIKIDENRFKLSTTLEGSRNYVNDSTNSDSDDGIDEFIDLGSSAGEHTIEYADTSINYEVKVDPPVVDSSSDIDGVNDTITIAAHGFETGTAVTYSKVSGDVISGLEDGETYYVVKIDDDTFQLSTSLLGAKNSSIIDLETVAGEHTIWNGNLNKPTTDIDMYGHEGMDNDFDNEDGDDIDKEMLQALDQIPTAVPGTKTVHGLAVTAINQDDLMTIAASAGGSGTCAVEISGAINLIEVEVNAYIGDANINQDNSHYTNTGTEQSVTVIAANDLYLLNVSAAAGFSGAAAITPNAGVNIIDNTISAHIDDANVRAYKDVIVTANAKETLVTIAAGISGSGAAAIDASVDVLFLTNNVFAYIGDESDAGSKGATVLAFGNVLVDAQHASDIISVAGSIAVGNFGGGAGVGIYNFENNVRAFIGPHSKVDALARSTSLANVYDGTRDSDNVLQKHTAYYGVAVQAINSEEILAISAAVGGGAAFGLGGGVQIDTFESDVQAYIGHDSHINMDALNTSAGSDQAVTVFASNSADIFSFAGALGIGISTGALSGAVAVGVIRNDSLAFVEERTQIAANDDVKVIALNNREVLSITVSGSIGCYAGIAGAVTIWTIGDEHNSAYEASDDSVEYEVDHEGERFGTVQENVLITTDDDDNERTTISNSQQVGLVVDALLSTLTGFDTMSDEEHKINQNRVDATNKIENKTNQKLDRTKIEDILNATDTDVVGSETTVYLGASVDVNIRSNGDGSLIVKADDNFEFEPIVGSLGGGLVGLGAGVIIANVGSKSEAYFAEHVDVEVNNNIGDVIVEATFTEDIYAQGYGGGVGAVTASAKVIILNDTTSQYAHLENNAEIRSANIVRVKAHADRKIDFDTLEIGVAGVAINVIVVISDISGITYAYADNPQIGQVAGMTVNDFEIIANQDIEGELIGRLIGASAGFSLSGLVIISDINNDIQAYQNNGDVKLARNMKIDAQQNADMLIDVPEVICASFTGSIGATVILSENISTIKAYVSNDPTLTIGGNFDMKTLYDSKIEIEVLGVSAGLAAGIGVIVVDVEETPTIENHFYGNAIISGDYTQQSKINDELIVDLTGVSAGVMAGIGITLSWAENETSVSTGVQNGSVINANNMLIKNIIDIDVDNDIITVGAGLLAGTGNDGDAEITLKKADAFINTSNIDITNSLTVLSEIGLNARMIIEGYSGGGIAVGVTLADSFIDAESVNTYIKNSNVSASELIVKTKYGFDQDNNKVGAYIETDAAGGGFWLEMAQKQTQKTQQPSMPIFQVEILLSRVSWKLLVMQLYILMQMVMEKLMAC